MKKIVPALLLAILSMSASAGETVFGTVRDGGSYEAGMRNAGMPLSGGLAWTVKAHEERSAGVPARAVLKGGGQYERQLLAAGMPVSGGLAWASR